MKDREDFSKVIADISILFELSLAIGQSLDLQTNCDRFLKTLMARKNLGYSSVWIKGEYLVDLPEEILLEDRDENSAFLVYANPEFRIKEKSIPPHHLIFSMLEGKEAFSIASTEDRFSEIITEKGIDKGIFAIFSLGKLGFLKLFSMMRETPFGKEELNQLNNVVSKFTISLEGCIAHQKVVRDITERKRAEEALKQSEETALRLARETATIAEIGRIISSTLNIEEVYQRFAEEVRKVLLFDRVTINMVDVEENIVTVPYAAGIPVPERQPGDNFPSAGSFTEVAIRTRRAMIFHPENENEVANRFPGLLPVFRAGLRSMMMIPLISRDEAIGVLHFAAIKPNAYTNIDLELAESIGAQIAGAIANAQLFRERERAENTLRKSEEEARRLAQENAVMAEIGRIISSTLNIEEAYDLFVKEAGKLIPLDRISIHLFNPEAGRVTSVYVYGVEVAGREAGESYPLAGSIGEKVMRTRKSLLIQTEDQDELAGYSHHLLSTFQAGLRSMMSVPLISKDQVIGVLHIRAIKPNAYTDKDVQLAERIGNQIAGAIANAQLFAERKKAEEEREKLIRDLQKALSEVKTLKGIFPICASCKKIRDDKGYWNQVEIYIRDRSEAEFSHGICPDCMKKLYGDFLKEEDI